MAITKIAIWCEAARHLQHSSGNIDPMALLEVCPQSPRQPSYSTAEINSMSVLPGKTYVLRRFHQAPNFFFTRAEEIREVPVTKALFRF